MRSKLFCTVLFGIAGVLAGLSGSSKAVADKPIRTEVITPLHKKAFIKKNGRTCPRRKSGGHPRQVNGILVFDGAQDGAKQVDPQIAVGGGYILHGTNKGLIIYNKKGRFVQGVHQRCFNGGIDPKLFYDPHNQVFGFDLWNPWDKEKKKPVNVSISETSDPRGAWNTYSIPAPEGRDGGSNAYSKKWFAYTFPGGREKTFVMKMSELKSGKPATVYYFKEGFGQPVLTQDDTDDLYFIGYNTKTITVTKLTEGANGEPVTRVIGSRPHHLKYVHRPPAAPQKGSNKRNASGDNHPKNAVLQNGHIWFAHTVNCDGRAAVQWHQVKLNGKIVQTGLIRHPTNSYIQSTIAVNRKEDVLIGFQESGPDMYISPRLTGRRANYKPGTVGRIISIGEGKGATQGGAWGDYSGSVVDGDNLEDLWTVQSMADEQGKGDCVIARISFKKPPARKN